MKRILATLFVAFLCSPCIASPSPKELMCSLITKAGDGYRIVPSGISVLDKVMQKGPFALPKGSPGNVAAIICFRSSIVPVPEDRKVLDAGYTFDIATRASGTIELSKKSGRYQARQVTGTMSASERESLDSRLQDMNAPTQPVPVLSPKAPKDKSHDIGANDLDAYNAAIAPYVAKAKQTYPAAKKRFLEGLPPGEYLYVTTRIHDPSGHFEQVFIAVRGIEGNVVHGVIASQIRLVSGYALGSRLDVPESAVMDWLITHPDGSEEGNFVGKFLDTYHYGNGDRRSPQKVNGGN